MPCEHLNLRLMSRLRLAAALLALALPLAAQGTATPPPHFEAAAIKPYYTKALHWGWMAGIQVTGEKLEARQQSPAQLVQWAYDLQSPKQIFDMPGWATDKKFDIVAVLDLQDPVSYKRLSSSEQEQQVREAMKSLLAERFGLKKHADRRDIPVYALERDKNFKEPDVDALLKKSLADGGRNPQTYWPSSTGMWWSTGDAKGYSVTPRDIIDFLESQPELENRPVVDHSHITTTSFKLKWATEGSSDTDDPPLLTALHDQAGLRLIPTHEDMDVLVIDHIDPPTPN